MLEEMGKASDTLFNFITCAGLYDNIKSGYTRAIKLDGDNI